MNSDFYKRILDNLNEGVYFVDTNGLITYWNKAAEVITGFSADEVLGRACSDNILVHVNDGGCQLCLTGCPLKDSMDTGGNNEARVYLHHKDGHRIPIRVRTSPIYDEKGLVEGGVEVFTDDRENHMAVDRIRELENLANFDVLTNLPNRRLLNIFLLNRMEELNKHGWHFGLMMLDIDHFKKVNDTYGHQIGDEVLKMIGKTLDDNTRNDDLTGRWGGEEFMTILAFMDDKKLAVLAERFRMLIQNSRITIDNQNISVTVSIGATIAQPGESIESLVERADQLLYQSKQYGRNRVTVG